MGAAFEMLSAVLVRSSSSDTKISLSAKLTNEAALANWLGEPVTILQSWRIKYVGASPIRYRLGFVCEWIVNHIIPILSQPMPDGSTLASNSAEIAAQWKSHIPAMIVDEKLIGFFGAWTKTRNQPIMNCWISMPLHFSRRV